MNKSLFNLIILLSSINSFASYRDELKHPGAMPARAAIFAVAKTAVSGVSYNQEHGFAVQQDGKWHRVPKHLVDKNLRDRSNEEIAGYLSKNFVNIKKGSDGQFSVQEGTRAHGGGAGGAWFGAVLGKTGTYVVCHGTIKLVSATVGFFGTPAAGAAVDLALTTNLALPIEAASNKVAIGMGILFGSATGPF